MHVFRWDLDRTYLDTDIHSVRGLMRAALEGAARKRTVPGAAALLRELVAHDPGIEIEILSGSPTQMRQVIQEKLALDGIVVDRLILKDNLGNLRRGRLRAVRGQVGYKLPELLRGRHRLARNVQETLFGDDSEADAVIYAGYAEAVAGRLSPSELARLLERGGAYPDAIEAATAALGRIDPVEAVEDIFIRVDRGAPLERFHLLGSRVIAVYGWLQAAMVLVGRGRLPQSALGAVAADLPHAAVCGLIQDAARRRLVSVALLESLLATDGFARVAEKASQTLKQLGTPPPPPRINERPDLFGFLDRL